MTIKSWQTLLLRRLAPLSGHSLFFSPAKNTCSVAAPTATLKETRTSRRCSESLTPTTTAPWSWTSSSSRWSSAESARKWWSWTFSRSETPSMSSMPTGMERSPWKVSSPGAQGLFNFTFVRFWTTLLMCLSVRLWYLHELA